MPRRKRMYVAGFPYHLVQRGNNREACFYGDADYQLYLALLQEYSERYGVDVHAYVLMTNHVHLLMTPDSEDSISRLMKVLGSRYAFYMNKRYRRTGTMWEGRHKSSVVDAEAYLLKCYRYIELNPVRACMVEMPEEYRWSSYCINAWGDKSEWLKPHSTYLTIHNNNEKRCFAYRELFRCGLDQEDLHHIRKATHYSHPLGNNRFAQRIETLTGCSVGQCRRGRPRLIKE